MTNDKNKSSSNRAPGFYVRALVWTRPGCPRHQEDGPFATVEAAKKATTYWQAHRVHVFRVDANGVEFFEATI